MQKAAVLEQTSKKELAEEPDRERAASGIQRSALLLA